MAERPITYDHLRSRKKPNTKTVRLALNSELADAYEEAKDELDRLKTRIEFKPDDLTLMAQYDQALERYTQARAAIMEESVEFKFRSVGRKKFDDLINAHPPTDAQIKKAKENGVGDINWNEDTFPPTLIFRCLVSPALAEEEVKDLWESDDWSGSEVMSLFLAAMEVNTNGRTLNLGKD